VIAEGFSRERAGSTRKRRRGPVAGCLVITVTALAGCGTPPAAEVRSERDVRARLAVVARQLPGAEQPPGARGVLASPAVVTHPSDPEAAFREQLRSLKGRTVVVMFWANWCPPCRRERPLLQQATLALSDTATVIGVASESTSLRAARTFVRQPVFLPFPSIYDQDGDILDARSAVTNLPVTIIFNRSGRQTSTHLGAYDSVQSLAADVVRYG
jgi:thiol-disulfide isomerase/thioredoxin